MEEQTAGMHITASALEAPLCHRLGRDHVTADTWQVTPFTRSGGSTTGGIFRVEGSARDGGETIPFALVLKVARAPEAGVMSVSRGALPGGWGHDATHSHYWRREALAYQSGLLADLAGGLAAPRCYAVQEQSEDSAWLWLEDITDTHGAQWPPERYALAARHLGQFNGAYPVGRPVPSFPWLSSDWMRQECLSRASSFAPALLLDPQTWAHPLVRRAFPEPVGEEVVRLWTEREQWLAALDRLPQTFCHLDAHRGNLFARLGSDGVDQTVAIDWAFTGVAALGTDIGQLASTSCLLVNMPTIPIADYWETVLAGYLAGLADAGWRGDDRLAAFGAIALAVVRWGFLMPTLMLGIALDERRHARTEQRFQRPVEDFLRSGAAAISFLLGRASAARAMLRELT